MAGRERSFEDQRGQAARHLIAECPVRYLTEVHERLDLPRTMTVVPSGTLSAVLWSDHLTSF
jgi:hypothetical protein